MTTVYINIIKGTVYTDSRCTTTISKSLTVSLFGVGFTREKLEVVGHKESRKIYAMHNCAVATVGDVLVSDHLMGLFEEGFNPADHVVPETLKECDGRILIVRPGYTICIHLCKGKLKRRTIIADNMTAGSGIERGFLKQAQNYLWALSKEQIIKVLKLSSLFDVYSDDNIVCVTPEDYRGNNVDL